MHKTKDYTVMSNHHLKDKGLSLKAKGLLSIMMSLPDDWDYSARGLETLSSDGIRCIKSTLKELEEEKYLIRSRVFANGKIVDWQYDIFENPLKEQEVQNVLVQNVPVENVPVQNVTQLNTKELNTKRLNTKEQIDADFEKFWDAYPKKVGKKDARKAWGQLKGVDLHEVLDGLENWRSSNQWQKDKGQYIPYPATFLRSERWKESDKTENCKEQELSFDPKAIEMRAILETPEL